MSLLTVCCVCPIHSDPSKMIVCFLLHTCTPNSSLTSFYCTSLKLCFTDVVVLWGLGFFVLFCFIDRRQDSTPAKRLLLALSRWSRAESAKPPRDACKRTDLFFLFVVFLFLNCFSLSSPLTLSHEALDRVWVLKVRKTSVLPHCCLLPCNLIPVISYQ